MSSADLIPSRGAIGSAMVMTVVRELTAEDVFVLMTSGGRGDDVLGPPPLQKLKARHHMQARLLAQGKRNTEVAAITNTTAQRISDLQKDPTFMELVGYYSDQMMVTELEDATRIQRKITIVAEDALDEIQDRLDDPQRRANISTDTLLKISADALGRSVAPQKVAQSAVAPPTNITFNIAGRGLEPPPTPSGRPGLEPSRDNAPLTIEHEDHDLFAEKAQPDPIPLTKPKAEPTGE